MARYAVLLAWCAAALAGARSIDMAAMEDRSVGHEARDLLDLSALSPIAQAAVTYERSNFVNGLVDTDPFYTTFPAGAAKAAAGSLIKVEAVSNVTLFTLPPTTSLSRIIYQTKTRNGTLVPASAYILWPYSPRKSEDGFQVVAWGHGTSGICANCAPSHIRNLWQHFLAPYQLALAGYVVVATDYAGLGVPNDANGHPIVHEFLSGPGMANDVVYSVQAARQAFPQLSKQFVVMGHSQGGEAAWAVAQRQAVTPVEGYLGAVAVSPITNPVLDNSAAQSIIVTAMMPGISTTTPGFDPSGVITPAAQAAVDSMFSVGGCLAMADAVLSGFTLLQPNWQNNKALLAYNALTLTGGKATSGPLLVLQGEADPQVNITLTTSVFESTMAAFPKNQMQFIKFPGVSHVPALQASQQVWMDWIAARFAGESLDDDAEDADDGDAIEATASTESSLVTADSSSPGGPPSCGCEGSGGSAISEATPFRPTADNTPELNWFIGLATEFFETP